MVKDVESDCKASRYSPYQYAIVNIAYKYGYSYCNHDITPKEQLRDPRNEGYKKYVHTLPKGSWNSGSYYLGGIYHKGTKQTGFIYTRSCHTNVVVYYWSHDEDNLCPLLIRVRKTWLSWNSDYYYEYYIPTGINTNKWVKVGKDDNVPSGLTKVIKDNGFKNVVALKLDVSGNTYYANGDPSQPPSYNTDVKIKVTGPRNEPSTEYVKYTHSLVEGGPMRILSTKLGDSYKPFKKSVLDKPYNEACVYYSKNDTGHDKPLILELGIGGNIYYRLDNGEKWIHDPSIKTSNLKETLTNLSGAHVVDISKDVEYKCTSPGCNTYIKVDSHPEDRHKYTKRRHYINGNTPFSVSSFIGSGGEPQTGLSSPTGVTEVNVFWYPQQSGSPKPLLINFSNKWFRKTGKNTWEEVTKSDPNWPKNYTGTGEDEKKKIKNLLQQIDQEIQATDTKSKPTSAEEAEEPPDQSSLPTILWSTFGSGLGGSAIGVTIWKWPTIMSFLIAHL